jgi:serine/threonine-protein kinase
VLADFASEATAVAPGGMGPDTLNGAEATAVAAEPAPVGTLPGTGGTPRDPKTISMRSGGRTTIDTSKEMSMDATIPGAEESARFAVAAAKRARRGSATSIEMSRGMVGQVLGSYRIIEVLGEGGMGRVYLAEHTKIGRQVALKMLHSHLSRSPEVVRRFFDEARAVNRILHEHIVEITDFIENDGGDNYFIMEYLRGAPLSYVVDDEGRLSLARSLGIGVQVASALAAVHASNIVHRDLKPENIFITERGGQKDYVKLLDFGIAKLMGNNGEGLNLQRTEAGVIMGTPDYMSPEQASAKSIDHRTDIYSLGVILYELCTGVLPFVAEDFGDLVVMHKTVAPTPPSKVPGLLQEIPPPLDELILHCLAKKPEDRPATVKEVEERLRAIADEYAVELEHFDVSNSFVGRRTRKRRGGAWAVGLAAAGLAAAAGVAFTLSRGSANGSSAAPAPAVAATAESRPHDVPDQSDETPLVLVSFASEPAGAMVYSGDDVGGDVLGITPFTVALDQSDEVQTFSFHKDGFDPQLREVSLAGDATVEVTLQQTPEKPAPVASSGSPDDDGKDASRHRSKRHRGKKRSHKRGKKKDRHPKGNDERTGDKVNKYREGAVMDPFAN